MDDFKTSKLDDKKPKGLWALMIEKQRTDEVIKLLSFLPGKGVYLCLNTGLLAELFS